jgi:hypothetical protein
MMEGEKREGEGGEEGRRRRRGGERGEEGRRRREEEEEDDEEGTSGGESGIKSDNKTQSEEHGGSAPPQQGGGEGGKEEGRAAEDLPSPPPSPSATPIASLLLASNPFASFAVGGELHEQLGRQEAQLDSVSELKARVEAITARFEREEREKEDEFGGKLEGVCGQLEAMAATMETMEATVKAQQAQIATMQRAQTSGAIFQADMSSKVHELGAAMVTHTTMEQATATLENRAEARHGENEKTTRTLVATLVDDRAAALVADTTAGAMELVREELVQCKADIARSVAIKLAGRGGGGNDGGGEGDEGSSGSGDGRGSGVGAGGDGGDGDAGGAEVNISTEVEALIAGRVEGESKTMKKELFDEIHKITFKATQLYYDVQRIEKALKEVHVPAGIQDIPLEVSRIRLEVKQNAADSMEWQMNLKKQVVAAANAAKSAAGEAATAAGTAKNAASAAEAAEEAAGDALDAAEEAQLAAERAALFQKGGDVAAEKTAELAVALGAGDREGLVQKKKSKRARKTRSMRVQTEPVPAERAMTGMAGDGVVLERLQTVEAGMEATTRILKNQIGILGSRNDGVDIRLDALEGGGSRGASAGRRTEAESLIESSSGSGSASSSEEVARSLETMRRELGTKCDTAALEKLRSWVKDTVASGGDRGGGGGGGGGGSAGVEAAVAAAEATAVRVAKEAAANTASLAEALSVADKERARVMEDARLAMKAGAESQLAMEASIAAAGEGRNGSDDGSILVSQAAAQQAAIASKAALAAHTRVSELSEDLECQDKKIRRLEEQFVETKNRARGLSGEEKDEMLQSLAATILKQKAGAEVELGAVIPRVPSAVPSDLPEMQRQVEQLKGIVSTEAARRVEAVKEMAQLKADIVADNKGLKDLMMLKVEDRALDETKKEVAHVKENCSRGQNEVRRVLAQLMSMKQQWEPPQQQQQQRRRQQQQQKKSQQSQRSQQSQHDGERKHEGGGGDGAAGAGQRRSATAGQPRKDRKEGYREEEEIGNSGNRSDGEDQRGGGQRGGARVATIANTVEHRRVSAGRVEGEWEKSVGRTIDPMNSLSAPPAIAAIGQALHALPSPPGAWGGPGEDAEGWEGNNGRGPGVGRKRVPQTTRSQSARYSSTAASEAAQAAHERRRMSSLKGVGVGPGASENDPEKEKDQGRPIMLPPAPVGGGGRLGSPRTASASYRSPSVPMPPSSSPGVRWRKPTPGEVEQHHQRKLHDHTEQQLRQRQRQHNRQQQQQQRHIQRQQLAYGGLASAATASSSSSSCSSSERQPRGLMVSAGGARAGLRTQPGGGRVAPPALGGHRRRPPATRPATTKDSSCGVGGSSGGGESFHGKLAANFIVMDAGNAAYAEAMRQGGSEELATEIAGRAAGYLLEGSLPDAY